MAGQPKQSSRNRKIEPLNWAETANSPALKGMMSFLDITSEEVRSGHFKDLPQELLQVTEILEEVSVHISSSALTHSNALRTQSIVESSPDSDIFAPKNVPEDRYFPEEHGETPTGIMSRIAPVSGVPTGVRPLPMSDTLMGSVVQPVGVSLSASRIVLGSVPSQNRKIRKCRLSQDGHSAGEDVLYRILWDEGRPETANLLGSRLVRIGYAELANKARLHKANVRLNLASLTAKLAIEQNGDFNSRDMIAKAYRVLSYKEILERRRAAGLEFVIRQKNVVFVTESGVPIPLPGLPKKTKLMRGTNGDQPLLNPLPFVGESFTVSDARTGSVLLPGVNMPTDSTTPTGSTSSTGGNTLTGSNAPPVSNMLTGSDTPTGKHTLTGSNTLAGSVALRTDEYKSDLAWVSKAFNTFWTVDDVAAEQLLRTCRKIRPDAEAEEIAFFVIEKLELTRGNRSINNPVGLILATVPQSFIGNSFEIFRQRRRDSLRLATEDAARKAEEDRMMNEWMVKDAEKTLANPSSSEKQRQQAEEIIVLCAKSHS